jgi:hypothetical protein
MNLRSAPRVCWIAVLAGLAVTAYVVWRLAGSHAPNVADTASTEPALRASVDFLAVRAVPAGSLLINRVLNLGDQLSRWLTLLQEEEVLDRMDFLLDPRGAYILGQGEFTPQSLRQSIERAGGRCAGSLQEYPCTLSADPAGCTISVFTPAKGRFTAACATTSHDAESMAEEAAVRDGLLPFLELGAEDRFDGIARLTVNPARLEPLMREPPAFVPNLSIVARALEKAVRAECSLKGDGKGGLSVHLEAVSETESEAEQLRTLLAGLNEFAAAAADFGRGEKESSDWSTLLRSAQFSQQGTAVTGVWAIPSDLLRRLTAD